jgi:hypothetical protein
VNYALIPFDVKCRQCSTQIAPHNCCGICNGCYEQNSGGLVAHLRSVGESVATKKALLIEAAEHIEGWVTSETQYPNHQDDPSWVFAQRLREAGK